MFATVSLTVACFMYLATIIASAISWLVMPSALACFTHIRVQVSEFSTAAKAIPASNLYFLGTAWYF